MRAFITVVSLFSFSLIKKSETDEGIRMIDDGFAQICDMVNDLSMKVRTEAAGLLVGETVTNMFSVAIHL